MYLKNLTDLPLIHLMNENYTTAMQMLPVTATFASGIGPTKELIRQKPFMDLAKQLGLQVHPYTLQDDMLVYTNNPIDEAKYYLDHGVNGIFSDFTELPLSVFKEYAAKK